MEVSSYITFYENNNYYIYDAFIDRFEIITKDFYNLINSNDKKYKISNEYIQLCEKGFFSNNTNNVLYNKNCDIIDDILNRDLSHVVFQVTKGCNLRCGYCPFSQSNSKTRKHTQKMLNFKIAKETLNYFSEHSMDSTYMSIGFYGGEPLLNFKLIKDIVNYANIVFKGKQLLYSLTTNATLLSEEMLSFFENNNFQLVISIDGYKESNDINRKFAYSNDSVFDNIINKIEKIYNNHPKLYSRMGLNMVLDPSTNFSEYDKLLINYPYLKNITINASIIDDTYSDIKNTWNDTFIDTFFLSIIFMLFGIYRTYGFYY